jgi:hypothetical protein
VRAGRYGNCGSASSCTPISGEIYSSVVRHGAGIDQHAFRPLVRVLVAGQRHVGWIHVPDEAVHVAAPEQAVTDLASYRRPA